MLVLNCLNVDVAREALEVLASARLRIRPRRESGGTASGNKVQLELLRDGTRVYIGEPPGYEALECDLSTLVARLLPRHLATATEIVPHAPQA